MSYKRLNREIWKLWRHGKSLIEIVDYVSEYTHWSRYLSLVHVVQYLCRDKNVKLPRKVLRKAFNSTKDDFDTRDASVAWKFLLEKARII